MLRDKSLHLSAAGGAGGYPADPVAVTRAVLEKSPLLVYCLDLQGRTAVVNRRMRDLTGWDLPDLPDGERLLEALYPNDAYRGVVRALHDNWKENKQVRDQVTTIADRQGAYRKVAWSSARLKDVGGRTIGHIAMGVDVTEEKHLEQWARLQTAVMEHLSEGIAVVNVDGQVIAWTGGAAHLLGIGADGRVGHRSSSLFARDEQELLDRRILAALEAEGRFDAEVEMASAGGGTVPVRLRAFPLRNEHGQPLARLYAFSAPDRSPELEARLAALTGERADLERAVEELRAEARVRQEAVLDAETRFHALEAELEEVRARHAAELEEVRRHLAHEVETARLEGEQALGAALEEAEARLAAVRDHHASEVRALTEGHAEELDRQRALHAAALEAEAVARLGAQREAFEAAREALQAENERTVSALEAGHQREIAALHEEREREIEARDRALSAEAQRREDEIRAGLQGRVLALEQEISALRAVSAERERRADEEVRAESERAIAAAADAERRFEAALAAREADLEARHRDEGSALVAEAEALREVLRSSQEEATARLAARLDSRETELRQIGELARAETARARAALDELLVHLEGISLLGLVVAGPDGRIAAWSAGAEAATGVSRERAIGRRLHEEVLRVPGFDWESFRRVLDGGRLSRAVALTALDGTLRPAVIEASLLPGPDGPRVLEVVRDAAQSEALEGALFEERAMGVIGRLASLFRGRLDHLADALAADGDHLDLHARALRSLVEAWRSGAPAAEVEDRVRRMDLDAALSDVPRLLDDSAARRRDLRNLGRDLRRYVAALESGGDGDRARFPVNEAVESALHLATGDDLPQFVLERHYADPPALRGRGHLLFPLLVQVFGSAARHLLSLAGERRLAIRTGAQGGAATLEISHSGRIADPSSLEGLDSPARPAVSPGVGPAGLAYAAALARLAGGSLAVSVAEDATTYRIELPAVATAPLVPRWRLDVAAEGPASLPPPVAPFLGHVSEVVPLGGETAPEVAAGSRGWGGSAGGPGVEVLTDEGDGETLDAVDLTPDEEPAAPLFDIGPEATPAALEALPAVAEGEGRAPTWESDAGPTVDAVEGDLELLDFMPDDEAAVPAVVHLSDGGEPEPAAPAVPNGEDEGGVGEPEESTTTLETDGDDDFSSPGGVDPASFGDSGVDLAAGDVMVVSDIVADAMPEGLQFGGTDVERIEIEAEEPIEVSTSPGGGAAGDGATPRTGNRRRRRRQ
ncbi:PAS domain S-box protein [Myxococcota bacterium]|nr:PAS domain S-box protein [Myxococcota bacterium]